VPDLIQLLALPCCHPCSPLPDAALRGADGNWPAAGFPPAGAASKAKEQTRRTPELPGAPLSVPAASDTVLSFPELRVPRLPAIDTDR
jgi:hypothetical protein